MATVTNLGRELLREPFIPPLAKAVGLPERTFCEEKEDGSA
jgi:hypothetical protein